MLMPLSTLSILERTQDIFELYLPHFLQYYDQDPVVAPPLNLSACLSTDGEVVKIVEDLASLLFSIQVTGLRIIGLKEGMLYLRAQRLLFFSFFFLFCACSAVSLRARTMRATTPRMLKKSPSILTR